MLVKHVDEVAAAVGAGDLAVAEHVAHGDELFLEDLDALAAVGLGAVVAVAEVEQVDVPLVGAVVGVEKLLAGLERAADLRAAVLAQVVEGVLVHLLGADVVDDVTALDPLVIFAEPGVDPEALQAHQLLLLLAHRSGDVHHEDDDRVALGALDLLPAPVPDVLLLRDDDGVFRVVIPNHDLPLEGLLERPLEVAERVGADLADAAVLVALGRDPVLALGLDPGELQLLGQDLGQLVQRQVHLHQVLALLGAALGAALALADDVALLAVPGADAGGVVAVPEMRQLDPPDRDADQVLALLADQLPLGEELAEVLPDPALHDLPEPLMIFFDLEDHETARLECAPTEFAPPRAAKRSEFRNRKSGKPGRRVPEPLTSPP